MRMLGITSGAESAAAPATRSRLPSRISPKAALVPMATASGVENAATCSDTSTASRHPLDSTRLRYHCNDQPGGGNWNVEPPERLIGIRNSVGTVRKAATAHTTTDSTGDRLIGRSPPGSPGGRPPLAGRP